MSCSKQHGTQAFIGFIADSTGETVSQQDWHDLREMAEELGGNMSKERVSPQEAIATLKALDSHLKANKAASAPQQNDVASQLNAMTERSKKEREKREKEHKESMEKIRASLANATETFTTPPSAASPTRSPRVAKAEQELLATKVTRGTITVIKMFIAIGVTPLLNLIRERREENRLMKAEARKLDKAMKHFRNRSNGYW